MSTDNEPVMSSAVSPSKSKKDETKKKTKSVSRSRKMECEKSVDSESDCESEDEQKLYELTTRKTTTNNRRPRANEIIDIVQKCKKMSPHDLLYKLYERKVGKKYLDHLGHLVCFLKDRRGRFRKVNAKTKEVVNFLCRPNIPHRIRMEVLKKQPDFFHKLVFPHVTNIVKKSQPSSQSKQNRMNDNKIGNGEDDDGDNNDEEEEEEEDEETNAEREMEDESDDEYYSSGESDED